MLIATGLSDGSQRVKTKNRLRLATRLTVYVSLYGLCVNSDKVILCKGISSTHISAITARDITYEVIS